MGTFQALDWAFKLGGTPPDAKLMAIYIASLWGMAETVTIDEIRTAEWCGFLSPALRIPRLPSVRGALQSIPGIRYEYVGDGKITIKLEV